MSSGLLGFRTTTAANYLRTVAGTTPRDERAYHRGQLAPPGNTQLRVDAVQHVVDRAHRHHEPVRDRAARQPRGHQAGDLQLPDRQVEWRLQRGKSRRRSVLTG